MVFDICYLEAEDKIIFVMSRGELFTLENIKFTRSLKEELKSTKINYLDTKVM